MTVLQNFFSGGSPAALLFDLDGTLVDSVPDIATALVGTLRELQLPEPTEEQSREWVGNGAKKLVQRGLAWATDKTVEDIDDEVLKTAHEIFLRQYRLSNGVNSRLYDGVLEALDHWHRQAIPMALVTNKPIQFVPKLLADLNIADYFSVLLGGECVEQKKPNPMMLFAACEQLGVKPEQCLMVGDSRNDIAAARAANMPVVAVDYGYNHGRPVAMENPDLLLGDLRELLD